jgi:hypothetical protein
MSYRDIKEQILRIKAKKGEVDRNVSLASESIELKKALADWDQVVCCLPCSTAFAINSYNT